MGGEHAMKRQVFAASLSQTVPALIGMAIPALYFMTPAAGGTTSLATLGRAAALVATTLFNYLLAVAAVLAAAG
jgi:hypothetical protein